MARAFNGSSQAMETAAALDLSGSNTLSISFWLKTVYAADDDIAFEFSTNSNNNDGCFKLIVNESSTDNLWYDQKTVAGPITASGRCADPGDSVWHHIVVVADRSVTTIEVVAIYFDGVSQSLTRLDGNNSGNYGNFVLYVMSRASGSLWADGDFAELALWPGTLLDQTDVDDLYNGGAGNLATVITPDPSFYWRVLGDDSPEPEFNGGTALTLVGSPTQSDHPFEDAAPAVVTGTAGDDATEAEIVAGGETIIITLNADTWLTAAGGQFDAVRQDIIDGLNSNRSELTGWNNEVRDNLAVTTVARTSDTVVTITLSAQAGYDITGQETITVTVPASALTTGPDPIVAEPSFLIHIPNLQYNVSPLFIMGMA